MKTSIELPLPSNSDLTGLARKTSLALSLAVLTLGGGLKTTGADSTWNSPTDFADAVWEYDAGNDVWWELKPDGTRRDDGILNQANWNGTAPFWDDDDFIIAYHGQVCVFDHDLRFKHFAAAGSALISNVALTPDGLLRSVLRDGGVMFEWAKDGPFRYIHVPIVGLWQEDIKVAADGLTYGASSSGLIIKIQPGDDFDWPHAGGFRYGNFATVSSVKGETTLSALAIVPDDTLGDTLWTCGVAQPSFITSFRSDLTTIDEWAMDFDETDFSTFFYDKNSQTVLGGRFSGDAMVAVEYDAKKHTKLREFRLFPEVTHAFSGITRGPNDTVVAIDRLWSTIYQWKADGTFLRAVHLPSTSAYLDEQYEIGGIVWAGTVANSSPNTRPLVSCAQVAPVDCVPNSGIPRTVTAYVTDPDASQQLTVTLKSDGEIIDQKTVNSPAQELAVNFDVEAWPGVHALTVEVWDGEAFASCNTRMEISADQTPPTLTRVPTNIEVETTDPEGAIVNFNLPTASDLCSGVVPVRSSHQPGARFPIGKTWVTFSATDKAGNTAYAQMNVNVVHKLAPISWSGWLAPFNTSSRFRIGQVIQVRFKLTGKSAGITDLVAYLTYSPVVNGVPGKPQPIQQPINKRDGNQFTYNPKSGFYALTWDTLKLRPGTYQIQIDMGDGISRTRMITLH